MIEGYLHLEEEKNMHGQNVEFGNLICGKILILEGNICYFKRKFIIFLTKCKKKEIFLTSILIIFLGKFAFFPACKDTEVPQISSQYCNCE